MLFRKKFNNVLSAFLVILLLLSNIPNATAVSIESEVKSIEKIENNSYFISLKKDKQIESFLEKKKLKQKKVKRKLKSSNTYEIELNESDAQNLLGDSDPDLEYIEVNSSVSIEKQEDSPTLVKEPKKRKEVLETIPWGVNAIGADLAADKNIDGKKVKVAVLDTGISNHQDLNITDGISFVEGSSFNDDNGHGTHVAGTLSALRNNAGILGTSPNIDLYSVKVLDKNGSGTYSQVIQGIEWAMENNIDILSMSFGGDVYSRSLHLAIKDAYEKGLIIVAAAGNKGFGEENILYPAAFPEVISVGAITKYLSRAEYSSTGSKIDIMAPGTNIFSTLVNGNYGVMSGTSMAAPHVAGAAAILLSDNKKLTNKQVIEKLYDSATPLGSTHEYGRGLLNVAKALGLVDEPIKLNYGSIHDSEGFNMKNIDQELSGLINKLLYLKEKAVISGDVDLAKKIDDSYQTLLVKNSQLHQIPINLQQFSKDNYDLLYSATNDYYSSIKNEFFTLINEYKQEIANFNNLNTNENDLNNSEFDSLGNYYFTTSPGSSHYQTMYLNDSDYYSFTSNVTGSMNVTLSVPSNADYDVQIIENGSVIASGTNGTGSNENVSFNVISGNSYQIRVYYYSGASGGYNLYVSTITPSGPTVSTIYLNNPIDVNLGTGESQVFKFTPSSTDSFKIYTGPYGNYGSPNDTYLELYTDAGLTNKIAFDDDSNGNTFSIIKTYLTGGTSYYIKLRPYSSSGYVNARIAVERDIQIQPIFEESPIDIEVNQGEYKTFSFTPSESGKFSFYTQSYAGLDEYSDTYLQLYDNSGLTNLLNYNDDSDSTTFSTLSYDLVVGRTYYIKYYGYNNQASRARLSVSYTPNWLYSELTDDNDVLINKSYIATDNNSLDEARVLTNNDSTLSYYQRDDQESWTFIASYPYDRNGHPVEMGYLGNHDEIVNSTSWINIKKVDIKELTNLVLNLVLSKINLSINDLDEEDAIYFKQGIKVGIDDNILFGLFDKLMGLTKYEDDYYYLTGKLLVDTGSTMFYGGFATAAITKSKVASATALSAATAGGVAALVPAGVPVAVASEGIALRALLVSFAAKAVAVGATAAAGRSSAKAGSTSAKINNLEDFNRAKWGTGNSWESKISYPGNAHRNKTTGHWETMLDKARELAQNPLYVKVYLNQGLKRAISTNGRRNNRPDVWAVRSDGKIDQWEVPSKTDSINALTTRMEYNKVTLGDKAGKIEILNVYDKYK